MLTQDASTAPVPRSQTLFDKSAQVRPCSSQVWEESQLPVVSEASQDDIFAPLTPTPPRNSTTATAPSTTDTAPFQADLDDLRGQKGDLPASDTSYSRTHRTTTTSPSNYPKRPNRPVDPPCDDTPTPPRTSTTGTALSTTDTAPSDADPSNYQGQKRAPSSSGTSYSRIHRAITTGPSNYPKQLNRPLEPSSDDDDQPPPQPRRRLSSDTDYSREHRADPADRRTPVPEAAAPKLHPCHSGKGIRPLPAKDVHPLWPPVILPRRRC